MVVSHDAIEDESTAHVRRAGPADLATIRGVLARALAPDPLMDWIFGGHPRREAAVAAFLWDPVEAYTVAGTVWLSVEGERAVGAAAWSAPWTPPPAVHDGADLPGRSMLDLLLPEDHAALVRSGFGAMRGQLPEEPHALLHLLGVDADRRGHGIGGSLIEAGLAAIPGNLPAHVNTTVEANVRLYEAHGFARVSSVRLGERGPLMHALRRPPGRSERSER
jgi:GNAT superfamily N-acetyltransferase